MNAAGFALIMALALLIGAMMGLLGGGGGFLYVLVLIVIAQVPAHVAVGTGVATAAIGAAVSLLGHHRAGNVEWQRLPRFLASGVIGTIVASILISFVPQRLLLVLIIIGYGVVGVLPLRLMRRGAQEPRESSPARHTRAGAAAVGAIAGVTVGAFAVNGGPLISSYLAGYERVEPRRAVGTAVAVLTPLSVVGSLTHLAAGTIDLGYLLALAPAAAVGGYVGAYLARLVRARVLAPILGLLTIATMFVLLLR